MAPFKMERGVPSLTLLLYAAFVPCALLCSQNWLWFGGMAAAGGGAVLLDIFHRVERQFAPHALPSNASLTQDAAILAKVLSTTLIPILLATYGGASYVFATTLTAEAADCTVSKLPRLLEDGFARFACRDGFVATDLQVGIPAWDAGAAGRRLEWDGWVAEERALEQRSYTVGTSVGSRFGYAAPIFKSREAAAAGAPPVAWAVSAGRPIGGHACDGGGVCGFFAGPLQQAWTQLPSHGSFGEEWGFNITHFSTSQMEQAVMEARKAHDMPPSADADQTFVVVSSAADYFSFAYPMLYALVALLCVGALDRCSVLVDARVLAESEELLQSQVSYDRLRLKDSMEDGPGLLEAAAGFWDDPLHTKCRTVG